MSGKYSCCFMIKSCAAFGLGAILALSAWAADTEKVAYSFTGGNDGGNPAAQLIFDGAGNAYGTTVVGGLYGCGTVFELTPLSGGKWQESVLYNFSCFGDGKNPYGGVTFDGSGNLYGTTVAGGSGGACTGDGCGVVYKLTPSGGGWTQTVLYNFTGGDDGYGPGSAVVLDKAGNVYGTAPDGGAYSQGVIYQLSLKNGHWQQTVIHPFTGGDDGAVGSLGSLLLDAVGNLYGVTELGGRYGAGIVFKLSSAGGSWKLTTLYAFQGLPDAGYPYGGLIADAKGNLYGTTTSAAPTVWGLSSRLASARPHSRDGRRVCCIASRVTPTQAFRPARWSSTRRETSTVPARPAAIRRATVARSLSWLPVWADGARVCCTTSAAPENGSSPSYGLTPDGLGNYSGTTPVGGAHGQGVVFEITP